jgi:hypothetical protein
VLILDSLALGGSVRMLMGLSTAGSLHRMLPDSLILECTYCQLVYARGGQWAARIVELCEVNFA